ncbi:hypothetical protein BpHYR1_041869 [Brachionus plicatilis]|uniref:Uncharacterized protein n=1 Tax=Brachionus plicatilis TaxID=10195 RepID=A0A3M7SWX5_BRAPC|nr:hypothetical protein BpHYR1_041869 [Brachionus plicatilis]
MWLLIEHWFSKWYKLIIQIKYDPNLKDKLFFDLKTKIMMETLGSGQLPLNITPCTTQSKKSNYKN